MKKLLLTAGLISMLSLAACGESDNASATETNDNNTEDVSDETTTESTDENSDEETEETEESEHGEFVKELNEVVADNDNFKATLVSIEKEYDDFWEEETISINFEVENKSDSTLTFQAREVSVDGKMVDESFLSMSQDVSGGKMADAELTLQDYEGGELPSFESDFEMLLHVFDMESYETTDDVDVSIEF